jgi:pyrimidine-nucleoside phosphorylase
VNFEPILETRRDAGRHTFDDLKLLANGAATGSIPDYQLAAWLMAAYLNPLDLQETVWLTQAMAESGDRVDLTGLPKPWVDKHSTGGVGDKTTIVLLPLLAACGLTTVKMSGKGLGITGGTVDKLASIPGFRLSLTIPELIEQAKEIGLALTGQTPVLAPADKVLYGLRDVTATVGSIPLIVSSILSKKIAGGAETIVIDVKCGSGAFMTTFDRAEELARALLEVGGQCGLKMSLSISDMDQPLGAAVGNALEVREALTVLLAKQGALPGPSLRVRELCIALAAETLHASGLVANLEAGQNKAEQALASGAALKKAELWIAAQGGPEGVGKVLDSLPEAPVKRRVMAEKPVWISQINAGAVGQAALELGAGRRQKEDTIDHAVGIELHCCVGAQVEADKPLFTIHARTYESARIASTKVFQAFQFNENPVEPRPVILKAF